MVRAAETTSGLVVECRLLRKRYGNTLALDGVDMSCYAGHVHALVGQNGAGKSTLVKILAGVESPDSGEIRLRDSPVIGAISSPSNATELGIGVVHQDHPLVSGITVAENMLLGIEPRGRLGGIDRTAMRSAAKKMLSEIGTTIDPAAYVEDLRVGQREQVAIASALLRRPRLLILDEPTASLGRDEVRALFEVIEHLKERGTAMLFVSHFLDDVKAISEEITVLRDGVVAMHRPTSKTTTKAISLAMTGGSVPDAGPRPKESVPTAARPSRVACVPSIRLEVDDLTVGPAEHVNFSIAAHECVAIVGVSGSGAEEVGKAVAGLAKARTGAIAIDGCRPRRWSRSRARAAGVGFVPSDRRVDGLFAEDAVSLNIVGGQFGAVSTHGMLRLASVRRVASGVIERLAIKCRSPRQAVNQLSGGNQQKVLVGRWVGGRFSILVLVGPTTGVDVGARADIYRAVESYRDSGGSVLLVSSDLDEVLRLAERVIVMVRGSALAPLTTSARLRPELLLELMLGGTTGDCPEVPNDK